MTRLIPPVLAARQSTPAVEWLSRPLGGRGTGPRWATGRGPEFGLVAIFEA